MASVEPTCQGHQGYWPTGGTCTPRFFVAHGMKLPCVTVWVARSELLTSQKERQWSHPTCPTTAGNIFKSLSLSHSSSCKMSPGSWTPLCTYPKASLDKGCRLRALAPYHCGGGGLRVPHHGSVEYALSPVTSHPWY